MARPPFVLVASLCLVLVPCLTRAEAGDADASAAENPSPPATGFVGYVDDAGPINSFTLTGATGAQGGISLDNLSHTNLSVDAGELHNQGVKFVLEHQAVPRDGVGWGAGVLSAVR